MRYTPPDASFRRLPFVYLLAVLITGILFQHWFPILDFQTGLLCFLTLLIFSSILLLLKKQGRIYGILTISCLLSGLFFSGILIGIQDNVKHQKSWFGHSINHTTEYWAEVRAVPELTPKTIKLTLSIKKTRNKERWNHATGKVLVYLYQNDSMPEISKGDFILFPNKLDSITNRGNPFEFDYASYLNRKGCYYQAFLSPEEITILHGGTQRQGKLSKLRSQLLLSLQKNIKDTTTASLTEATLLNERTSLDNQLWKAYSVTGIAHIIAISGMHVSLFFGIILAMLWWLKPQKLRWIKYFLGLPIIWGYIAITGFPPSAVRAAVMFTIIFVCLYLRKDQNPLNFLAATGFLLLCYNPLWLFDTGIQLSFSAVASIFLFYKPVHSLWLPKNKVSKYLWSAVSVSLAVQILVFPIVVYYFHQFPVWFLISNIPASVYSLLLMVMGLLIFLLDGLGIPCIWLGNLMIFMTHYFHQLIFLLASHTPEALRQLYLSNLEFWVLLSGIIFCCLFIFFKKTKWVFAGLTAFCLLAGLFLTDDYRSLQQQKIIVFNSSKATMIDYYRGQECFTIGSESSIISSKTYQYLLLPARIGYGVRKISESRDTGDFKIIAGKKILFLNKTLSMTVSEPFPVDYLILSHYATFQPEQWAHTFLPKEIILDGSFSRWQAKKWKAQLSMKGIPVYYVGTDGAWIFPKDQ